MKHSNFSFDEFSRDLFTRGNMCREHNKINGFTTMLMESMSSKDNDEDYDDEGEDYYE